MKMRVVQAALLVLAACSSSASTSAAGDLPFVVTPVATFDSPWAMVFLPGSSTAIVTEKPGRLWIIDAKDGRKQQVAGAPDVVAVGQGGLLDVAVSPDFQSSNQIYLTFAEPSPN